MINTHFANPIGLPVPGEYTTARDLVTLARVLVEQHPEAPEYTSRKYFRFNGFNQPNTNGLLFLDSRVRGLKTGHVRVAGFHLVALAETGHLELISAVMGAPSERSRVANSYKLLEWAFDTFATVSPDWHSAVPSAIRVRDGDVNSVAITPVTSPFFVVTKGDKPDFAVHANVSPVVTAPVRKGQMVGELTISLGDKVESIPIETSEAVSLAKSGVRRQAEQFAARR